MPVSANLCAKSSFQPLNAALKQAETVRDPSVKLPFMLRFKAFSKILVNSLAGQDVDFLGESPRGDHSSRGDHSFGLHRLGKCYSAAS